MPADINYREVRITTLTHQETNLMMAFSDDLPGLLVSGRSHEEIRQRIPGAITEMLEAQGEDVLSVEAAAETGMPSGFSNRKFLARAKLARAHVA